MEVAIQARYIEEHRSKLWHKRLRQRTVIGQVIISLPTATEAQAPIALLVPQVGLSACKTELRWYQKQLWRPLLRSELHSGMSGPCPIEEVASFLECQADGYSKEGVIDLLNQYTKDFLIIANLAFVKAAEPYYAVHPLDAIDGCSATTLTVEQSRRPSNKAYLYNALQWDLAVKEAQIAAAKFNHCDLTIDDSKRIIVFLPEAIQMDPQEEHFQEKLFRERERILSILSCHDLELILSIATGIGFLAAHEGITAPKKENIRELVIKVTEGYFKERLAGRYPDVELFTANWLHCRLHGNGPHHN